MTGPLAQLQPGQTAEIVSIDCDRRMSRRLMEMERAARREYNPANEKGAQVEPNTRNLLTQSELSHVDVDRLERESHELKQQLLEKSEHVLRLEKLESELRERVSADGARASTKMGSALGEDERITSAD